MQTMNSQVSGPPSLSLRFVLTIIAVTATTGLVLALLNAPFWVFWIAPVVIAPFMFHEARAHVAKSNRSRPRNT